MSIHQYDESMAPDADFTPGEIGLLCAGNCCRRLDPRRTPGVIETYFPESAIFRWRISAFEHKGKCWDLPAEEIVRFQFADGSKRLDPASTRDIERTVGLYDRPLVIEPCSDERNRTEADLGAARKFAAEWLERESVFFAGGEKLDLDSRTGPRSLAGDFLRYMASREMEQMESRTAENVVLNPWSGEWVKGMEIVLAQMGLAAYRGKVTRTKDVFEGLGAEHRRRSYLTHRLAFVGAYFELLGIKEVAIYRGMSPENPPSGPRGSLVSYTFNLEVARSFCDFDRPGRSRHSILLKRTVPVNGLFMTYLETGAMNQEYSEAEALVLARPSDSVI